MDRREALKKLAVSGAVVAGSSAVLSSQAVADTASCDSPNLVLTATRNPVSGGTFVVNLVFTGSFAAGTVLTTPSVVASSGLGAGQQLKFRRNDTNDVGWNSSTGPTSFTIGAGPGAGANFGNIALAGTFEVQLVLEWTSTDATCGGPAGATYTVKVVNGGTPSVEVTG